MGEQGLHISTKVILHRVRVKCHFEPYMHVNPQPAELNSGHNACAAEYPFTNWASPTEFSLGY